MLLKYINICYKDYLRGNDNLRIVLPAHSTMYELCIVFVREMVKIACLEHQPNVMQYNHERICNKKS